MSIKIYFILSAVFFLFLHPLSYARINTKICTDSMCKILSVKEKNKRLLEGSENNSGTIRIISEKKKKTCELR